MTLDLIATFLIVVIPSSFFQSGMSAQSDNDMVSAASDITKLPDRKREVQQKTKAWF